MYAKSLLFALMCITIATLQTIAQIAPSLKLTEGFVGAPEMPFDKEFTLYMPITSGDLIYTDHIKIIESSGPKSILSTESLSYGDLKGQIEKVDKKLMLKIIVPPLRPNRNYHIGILHKISGIELRAISTIHQIYSSTDTEICKLRG